MSPKKKEDDLGTMAREVSYEMDVEEHLQELDEHDQQTQLYFLRQEIQHIMEHGVQPSEEWFVVRFQKVYQYSELEWIKVAHLFKGTRDDLVESCHTIVIGLQELLEDWSTSPYFNLSIYYNVLEEIDKVVTVYLEEFKDEDEEVTDLIAGFHAL